MTTCAAAEEECARTETEWGPWTIVEATDQVHTSWKVLSTIDDAMAAGLRARGIDPEALSEEPPPQAVQGEAAPDDVSPAQAAPSEPVPGPGDEQPVLVVPPRIRRRMHPARKDGFIGM